jgi:hypothetical protein
MGGYGDALCATDAAPIDGDALAVPATVWDPLMAGTAGLGADPLLGYDDATVPVREPEAAATTDTVGIPGTAGTPDRVGGADPAEVDGDGRRAREAGTAGKAGMLEHARRRGSALPHWSAPTDGSAAPDESALSGESARVDASAPIGQWARGGSAPPAPWAPGGSAPPDRVPSARSARRRPAGNWADSASRGRAPSGFRGTPGRGYGQPPSTPHWPPPWASSARRRPGAGSSGWIREDRLNALGGLAERLRRVLRGD